MDEGDARAQGHAVPVRMAQARRPARLLPGHVLNPCMGEYNPDGPNYGAYAHLQVMREVWGSWAARSCS